MGGLRVTDTVRASRDGDQFHYHWAARQSLQLLGESDSPVLITVEGVSEQDGGTDGALQAIDLAEYWGSEDPQSATRVVYRQFKHSSARAGTEWTVSFLKNTLVSFARKFREQLSGGANISDGVRFEFITNRPAQAAVKEAVLRLADANSASAARVTSPASFLWDWAEESLSGLEIPEFYSRFAIHDNELPLRDLQSDLIDRTGAFLPGAPADQPLRLKEMVEERATNLAEGNAIRRHTVLVALGVTEDDLLPAPNELTSPPSVVVPPSWSSIRSGLVGGSIRKAIVHASGGMGKSVFADWLPDNLPDGWVGAVYDCFASGSYRSLTSQRHAAHRALVQLSNELAARMLCTPVIPSKEASPAHYMKTFCHRLEQALGALRSRLEDAGLLLIVDAADNSVLAAQSQGSRSFVLDLLREDLPDGVVLVLLARTERVEDLDPPPDCISIELGGFSSFETADLVRTRFHDASQKETEEFHLQTSGVPRVEAAVLGSAATLADALRAVGEAHRPGTDILDSLLAVQVAKARDLLHVHAGTADLLCRALATLPPRVPITVLSSLCGMSESGVASFASDVGRALLVNEGNLQFRDEPTETWFRTQFRPGQSDLAAFLSVLIPLASSQPYVASALPQLMLEGGHFTELVALALGDDALPDTSHAVRLEVKRNRTQFAVKAALRSQRWFDAARLALQAGTLEAGRGRRHGLIRANADLAGEFLPDDVLNALVASRALSGGWPGSNTNIEADLLAHSRQKTLARAKLRSAAEWMYEWLRGSSRDDDHYDRVSFADVAEIALGTFRLHGPEKCAEYMSRWRNPRLHYEVGTLLGQRLSTRDGQADISNLIVASRNLRAFALALARTAFEIGMALTQAAVETLCDLLKRSRKAVDCGLDRWSSEPTPLGAVVWAATHGLACECLTPAQAVRVVGYYLPATLSPSAGDSFRKEETVATLYGHALLSQLNGADLDPWAIASNNTLAEREKKYVTHQSVRAFDANVVPLARWIKVHLRAILDESPALDPELLELARITFTGRDYRGERPYLLAGWSARIASSLVSLGVAGCIYDGLLDWCLDPKYELGSATRIAVIERLSRVESCATRIVQLAESTATDIEGSRADAGERANDLVLLARAIYGFSPDEAKAYFDAALAIADRMGSELGERWRTQLRIARALPAHSDASRARRLSEMAESLDPYLEDEHDWKATVKAIGHLDPVTAVAAVSQWQTRRIEGRRVHIAALTDGSDGPLASEPLACLALVALDDTAGVGEVLREAVARHPSEAQSIEVAAGEFEHCRWTAIETHMQNDYPASNWLDCNRTAMRRTVAENAAYDALDPTSAASWEQAHVASGARRAFDLNHLVTRVIADVPLARLTGTLRALKASSWPSIYTYELVFKRLAERRPISRSAKDGASELACEAATRFCLSLAATHRTLNLERVHRLTGLPPRDLIERALTNVGGLAAPLTPTEHLQLACCATGSMTTQEIAQLFDLSSQQFEDLASLDAFSDTLATPTPLTTGMPQALAALVWTRLADPAIAERWRASHVVHRWAVLGCTDELEALAGLASSREAPAGFVDHRLPFYRLHALEWLLIGLARAAVDPRGVARLGAFQELLVDVLLHQRPHAVIQATAREIVRHTHAGGIGELSQNEFDAIMDVGQRLGLIAQEDMEAEGSDDTRSEASSVAPDSIEHDPLAWDFEDSWSRPLGEVFGLDQSGVLQAVHEAIRAESGTDVSDSLDDDPRHSLKLYDDSTASYHGEWAQQDDLAFYRGVHGHYAVAAQLVASKPMVKGRFSDSDDPFGAWLQGHLISRTNGRWLADRRDPPPVDRRSLGDRGYSGNDDPWLEPQSWPDPWTRLEHGGYLTVFENSSIYSLYHREHISTVTALVDPRTSMALLRALRESTSSHALITVDPCDRWNRSGVGPKFEPWDWTAVDGSDLGIDKHDPQAHGIHYPPARLAPWVLAGLHLTPDSDERVWTDDAGASLVRSTIWNDHSGSGRSEEGPQGDRLELHASLVQRVMHAQKRDLMIQVSVTRDRRDDYGGRNNDERERRVSSYFLVRPGPNRPRIS